MGVFKNWLIRIEELVWEAIERGFTDDEGIYAYVFMHDSDVTRAMVDHVLKDIAGWEQSEEQVA